MKKYFHNISHKTDAYNLHNIRNNVRDIERNKNDILSDS